MCAPLVRAMFVIGIENGFPQLSTLAIEVLKRDAKSNTKGRDTFCQKDSSSTREQFILSTGFPVARE